MLARTARRLAAVLLASCGLWMDSDGHARARAESASGGRPRAALVDLRTLLRKDPQMLEARVALGEVSLEMGDVASAIRELELARNGSWPLERWQRRLLAPISPGSGRMMRSNCSTRCRRSNSVASLSALRGTALLALGGASEAKQAFENAVRFDPKSVDALLGLASALAIEDVSAGLAVTDRALESRRTHRASGWRAVRCRCRRNRFAEAEKEFRAAADATKAVESDILLAALAGVTESLLARDETAGGARR